MDNKDICEKLLEQYGAEQSLKVRKKVSTAEKGVRYIADVIPEREIVILQVDGNIIKNGQKCDKLILAKVPNVNKKWIGYFVELKGSAITKAIAQLENTITHSKFNDSTLTKRYVRIVSSVGIPANNGNTELEKARNRFRSQYNCELKRLKPNQPDRI